MRITRLRRSRSRPPASSWPAAPARPATRPTTPPRTPPPSRPTSSSRPARRWPSSTRPGAITIGTKFDQPGFGLLNPRRRARGLRRRDRQDHRGEARHRRRRHQVDRDGVGQPRAVHPERPGRHRRRHLHDQRHPQAARRLRRPVLRGRPGHHGREGQPGDIEGPDDLAGKNVCSVEGSTPAQNIRDNYPEATLTLFDVYSKCADALRNGQVDAVTTDNVILTGLVAGSAGRLRAGRQPVHRGALRHRPASWATRTSATSSTTSSRSPSRTAPGPTPGTAPPARSPARGPRAAAGRPLLIAATPPGGSPGPAARRPPTIREGARCSSSSTTSPLLRDAFLTTLRLRRSPGCCALVLGTLLAAMRVSPVPPLRGLGDLLRRDLPQHPADGGLLLPRLRPAADRLQCSTFVPRRRRCAVGLYTAAFVCEAIRSGINAVAAGPGRGRPRDRADLRPDAAPGRAAAGVPHRRAAAGQRLHRDGEEHLDRGRLLGHRAELAARRGWSTPTPATCCWSSSASSSATC